MRLRMEGDFEEENLQAALYKRRFLLNCLVGKYRSPLVDDESTSGEEKEEEGDDTHVQPSTNSAWMR